MSEQTYIARRVLGHNFTVQFLRVKKDAKGQVIECVPIDKTTYEQMKRAGIKELGVEE